MTPRLQTLREGFFRVRYRRVLRRQVQLRRARGEPIKLVLGSGLPGTILGRAGTPFEGWLLTDINLLDALSPTGWQGLVRPASVDRVLAEHVVEHWTESQFRNFLGIVRAFLSSKGVVRIAVPDAFHPDREYRDQVCPGGSGPGAIDHKVFYDHILLEKILAGEHWTCEFLEYFDEGGIFHQKPWSVEDGFVARSAEHDSRNQGGVLAYTSLIADLRPKAGYGA